MGRHLLDASSSTQSTVRLSSGEAEYAAMVKGVGDGLFVRNILEFYEEDSEVSLESDSTAALSAARRLGPGKRLRHVATEMLFLQQLVRQGVVKISKADGKAAFAPDMSTKHLSWQAMAAILSKVDVRLMTALGAAVVLPTKAEAGGLVASGAEALRATAKANAVTFVYVAKVLTVVIGAALLGALATAVFYEWTRHKAVLSQCKTKARVTKQQVAAKLLRLQLWMTAAGRKAHTSRDCKALANVAPERVSELEVCTFCQDQHEEAMAEHLAKYL